MYHLIKKGKGLFAFDLYRGDTMEGKRHGFGIQLFPNGSYYIGQWSSNQANGKGRLVLPDNTYYEGEYLNNIIMTGCVVYFNGTRFDGSFDGTHYERFKNGTFTFSRGDKFKGEWDEGLVVKGMLTDREGRQWEFFKDDTIVRKYGGVDNYGVIVSKVNKWFYDGGIEDNECSGLGTIYCNFQQYKTGFFAKNQVNGHYRKVALNWGEIAIGECEFDQRIGDLTKILNKGIQIDIKADEPNVRVSFPFLNEDYFIGQLMFMNTDKVPYDFKYRTGTYYFKLYTGGYRSINVSNLDSIWDIKEVKEKGVSFEFTFERIFNNNDQRKMVLLKSFISSCIDSGMIKLSGIHSYISRVVYPELISENYSVSISHEENKVTVQQHSRSKTPVNRNKISRRSSKRGDISAGRKNVPNIDAPPVKHVNDNHVREDTSPNIYPPRQAFNTRNFIDSPPKEAFNLKKTVIKYDTRIDKSDLIKLNDIKETIIVKKDHNDRSNTPELLTNRSRFKSIINSKKPEFSPEFNPAKLLNEYDKKSIDELKVFGKNLFERIISSDDDDNKTVESRLANKTTPDKGHDHKKAVLTRDVKLIDDCEIDYFEGTIIKGKKQGFCKLLYTNGNYIEGNYNDDILDGPGYMVDENMIEYTGQFVKGQLQGKGSIKLGFQNYIGEFKKGKFSNDVVKTQKNGAIVVASDPTVFEDSVNRVVTIYMPNGYILETELFEGQFVLDKKAKLLYLGQKSWDGRIIDKKGVKFFESIGTPDACYQLHQDEKGYSIIL